MRKAITSQFSVATVEKGNDGHDGKDAATLVFMPEVVVFQANNSGVVPAGQSVQVSVVLRLPNGTTASPTITSVQAPNTDVSTSVSGSTITVSISEAYSMSDIEGYLDVTASATISSVAYTARGSVTVATAKQGATGQGQAGHVGRFYYYADEWDATVTYLFEKNQAPFVKASDGNFYMMDYAAYPSIQQSDVTQTSLNDDPTDVDYQGGKPWSQMSSEQKYYIAKAFFGEYAQFGSAIISGDYLFSTKGRIFNTDYSTAQNWKAYPTYTYFVGDTDAKAFSKVLYNYNIYNNGNYKRLHDNITLSEGEDVVMRFYANYLDKPSGSSIYIGVFNASGAMVDFKYWSDYYGTWQDAPSKRMAINVNYEYYIRFTVPTAGGYSIRALYSGSLNYSEMDAYLCRVFFEPSWWVDLKTGKNSAANGSFVAENDSVKITNPFKTVCLSWGGMYQRIMGVNGEQYMWIYIKNLSGRTDTAMLVAKYGLKQGDYFKLNEEMIASGEFDDSMNLAQDSTDFSNKDFIACIGKSDIVCCLDVSNSTKWSDSYVCLPRPQDFPGKTIELRHNSTTGSGKVTVVTVQRGANDIARYPHIDGESSSSTYRKIVYGSKTSSYTYDAGKIAIFYSNGTNWVEIGTQT